MMRTRWQWALGVSLIFGVSALFNLGCSKEKIAHEREDVVSVWKHEAHSYSVSIMRGNEMVDIDFRKAPGMKDAVCYPNPITILADVPDGNNMWYEADYYMYGGLPRADVTIHIRSPDDVGGAGGTMASTVAA